MDARRGSIGWALSGDMQNLRSTRSPIHDRPSQPLSARDVLQPTPRRSVSPMRWEALNRDPVQRELPRGKRRFDDDGRARSQSLEPEPRCLARSLEPELRSQSPEPGSGEAQIQRLQREAGNLRKLNDVLRSELPA